MGLGKSRHWKRGYMVSSSRRKRNSEIKRDNYTLLTAAVIKIQKLSYLLVAYVIQICPIKYYHYTFTLSTNVFHTYEEKENFSLFLLFQVRSLFKALAMYLISLLQWQRTLSSFQHLDPHFHLININSRESLGGK